MGCLVRMCALTCQLSLALVLGRAGHLILSRLRVQPGETLLKMCHGTHEERSAIGSRAVSGAVDRIDNLARLIIKRDIKHKRRLYQDADGLSTIVSPPSVVPGASSGGAHSTASARSSESF